MRSTCALIALATATACISPSASRRPVADEQWHLRETRPNTYRITVTGARDAVGSTVSIHADSAPASAYGQAEYGVPIRSVASERVSIAADIRPRDVRERATVWLRADRKGEPLVTEYAQIPARGTSDWQHQETGFVVPDGATSIVYGVLLQGPGEVAMRNLTIERTALPPPGTAMSGAAEAELDSALQIARTYALWRDTVSWLVLEARVRRAAAGAREPRDVFAAIRLLVAGLGDNHSSFYTPQDMATFRSSVNTPMIDVRALEDGVGFVNSPGYIAEHRDSIAAYVRRTHRAIRAIASTSSCGWVVDLRGNAGGMPEPMFAALEPFLGPDAPPHLMRSMLRQVGVEAPVDLGRLTHAPVAVLLGPQTGSAGERLALAFRQRPRTRFFGRPTAGVATTRNMVLLPDGAALAITTSTMDTTRTREKSQSIIPDVLVADQVGKGDPTLGAATAWVVATECSVKAER